MAFKIGQKAKVLRKVEHAEGWNNQWVHQMDEYVGREGTIRQTDVMGVAFEEFSWRFPEASLGLSVSDSVEAYTAACEHFEHEQALLFAQEMALEKAKAAVQDARLNLRDALDGET